MVFVDICIDYLITRFIRSDFQLDFPVEIIKKGMESDIFVVSLSRKIARKVKERE